jgi:hypothetical protein
MIDQSASPARATLFAEHSADATAHAWLTALCAMPVQRRVQQGRSAPRLPITFGMSPAARSLKVSDAKRAVVPIRAAGHRPRSSGLVAPQVAVQAASPVPWKRHWPTSGLPPRGPHMGSG